jgi:spoIIIJ-associated protein
MEWVETTGHTIEEAKDAALDQLGVGEQDAEFQVLEEPKPGLFGRVRGEARVRARVRPTQPRPKEDRRDRRRRESRASGTDGARPDRSASTRLATESAGQVTDTPEGETMEEDVPLEQQADEGVAFVRGLVDRFELSADIEVVEVDEDHLEIKVNGPDLGLLIGPKGATLAAVQELTRTVVQRRLRAHNGRLTVDVSGYRQRRTEALTRFTNEVASQVKATGERRILEPMSAADRKVVHDTANAIDGVATISQGEDPSRRVVIMSTES